MTLEIVGECPSTNSAIDPRAPHGHALMALSQSAGRGQRGNSWEAAPGLNITLSLMIRPSGPIEAARQFVLSEAVALGVADLLDSLGAPEVSVKWPNDIYAGGDRKICGILIENSLRGRLIERSIAGVGLNVNQLTFLSDAPNPVSLSQLTGLTYELEPLARRLVSAILDRLERGDNHADYCRRLWRGSGIHLWTSRRPDEAAGGNPFSASVEEVLPDGRLRLSGGREPYAFKEVSPVM